jgi:hypothetical protein
VQELTALLTATRPARLSSWPTAGTAATEMLTGLREDTPSHGPPPDMPLPSPNPSAAHPAPVIGHHAPFVCASLRRSYRLRRAIHTAGCECPFDR